MEEVVEGIEDLTDHREKVCLGDALDEFGSRSFGPLLVLLPLIEFSPIGGIPGVPTLLALLIASIAGQILLGKDHVWVPRFIERRPLSAAKLNRWAHRLEGAAARIDHWFKGRFTWLTRGLPVKIAAIMILVLCATVPPLEFLPFASSAPMLAIASFGLALLVRDGLLMLVASVLSGGAVAVAIASFVSPGAAG